MLSAEVVETDESPVHDVVPRPRLRWWREVLYVLVFYVVYSAVRNQFGSAAVSPTHALDNARRVIDLEKTLGLFFELRLQSVFLDAHWFLRIWNVFYGSMHFVVTASVMLWLYWRFPRRYRQYRTVLAWTTGLALIGFATFPLMPPRLLDAGGDLGAHLAAYPFADTLAEVGGLWSFSSGGMESISNQYAAMPSLHIGWALWCVFALYPVLNWRWSRVLLAIYPAITFFAIVVTANHYWMDALGGVVVFTAGWYASIWSLRILPDRTELRPNKVERDAQKPERDAQKSV
jgi:PAP2 superfamily